MMCAISFTKTDIPCFYYLKFIFFNIHSSFLMQCLFLLYVFIQEALDISTGQASDISKYE